MNLVLLTGSHPRHLYVARRLLEAGYLKGLLVEERGQFVPSPPSGLSAQDKDNFIRHFRERAEAEERAFGRLDTGIFKEIEMINMPPERLNSIQVEEWIVKRCADVVLSYGVHKIEKSLLDKFPQLAWNIHGGLSPWYRGNITLFWPFYFLQPNWAGMTIHELTDKIDGGAIIHHSVPELKRGDGIHDVASRAVIQAAEDLITILELVGSGREVLGVRQKTSGKLFTGVDWRPQHLRLIYNYFNNDIVDRYLDGELGHTEPPLVKAFY